MQAASILPHAVVKALARGHNEGEVRPTATAGRPDGRATRGPIDAGASDALGRVSASMAEATDTAMIAAVRCPIRGHPMQPSLADAGITGLHAGDVPIAGYRLVRRRGRGGFGEVWEAEASGGFRVALKFVHLSPRARAAELRSLDFVRGIRHPNLLASFGSWQVDDTLIVGMELADRSLWDRYIEAADGGLRGIPRGELLAYLAGSAAAIDYLNEARHTVDGREGVGVQHRDIKPPNILLCGGGAKVADLGLARAMEGDSAGHTGIWTYAYAAPEFFRGRTSRHSDQYGLAASYCQLRSGQLPFEGNAASVTAGHLFGEPDLDGLPDPERPILARALAKEPEGRWPDCRSFVAALLAIGPDRVPDRLLEPADSADIPREFRSSTGASAHARPTGHGPDGVRSDVPWRDFESIASLGESLMTPSRPAAHRSVPPTSPTAIPDGPEALPSTPAHPANPRAHGRGRGRRTSRSRLAVATLAMATVLATTGVHAPGVTGQDHRPLLGSPSPAFEPVPIADPGPEAAAIAEVRPAPEPGPPPPPPPAADELQLASIPRPEPDPAPSSATRSDLIPTRRARRDARPEPPAVLTSRPSAVPADGEMTVTLPGAVVPAPPGVEPLPRGPSPAEAAEARGRGELARGSFERAIVDLGESIRLEPGRAATYFLRGVAHHHARRHREALADYAEAVRLRPGDPSALAARGQAHHDLGDYDRAIADYSGAIRLRPGDPSAHHRRGLARYHAGDNAGAVADFTEAIRLDPKHARAYQYRGDAHARLGAGARAGADHDRAFALEGGRPRPAPPKPARP